MRKITSLLVLCFLVGIASQINYLPSKQHRFVNIAAAKKGKVNKKQTETTKYINYLVRRGIPHSFINGKYGQYMSKKERNKIKKSWQKNQTKESYSPSENYPIILSVSDNKGNTFKYSEYNGYLCTKNYCCHNDLTIREGETINVKVSVSEPQNRKVYYKIYMGNCNQQEWTEGNEFSCTITREGIESSGEKMRLFVYIKSEKDFYRTGIHGYDDGLIFDYDVIR